MAAVLPEWFSEIGLKNMKIDFAINRLIVAVEKEKILGFLCYTAYSGKMLLLWMGVGREHRRQKIGTFLLHWLEMEAQKIGAHSIEVETLPDENSYQPYVETRNFYYKNGFKRILYKKAQQKGWDDQIVLIKILKTNRREKQSPPPYQNNLSNSAKGVQTFFR